MFDVWQLVALVPMLTYVFLRYEETEDDRINDHAYVDIGGFLIGASVGAVGWAVALCVVAILT